MNELNFFINIAHGNEPYVLGTNIALAVKDLLKAEGREARIIVPLIYGERQKRIIKETAVDISNIEYDEESGGLLDKIRLSGANFDAQLEALVKCRKTVEEELKEHLKRTLGSGGFIEINAGSYVSADATIAYYVFPYIHTDLLNQTRKDKLPFNQRNIGKVLNEVEASEQRYSLIFIPEINMLSAIGRQKRANEESTPPLKHPRESTEDLEGAIFMHLSGTGSCREEIIKAAKQIPFPKYFAQAFKSSVAGVEDKISQHNAIYNPAILYNPAIKAVFGRPGWGILWECQVAQKPFISVPYITIDDPEIKYNIQILEEFGMGVVYTGQPNIVELAMEKQPSIDILTAQLTERFGTIDGINYAARKIFDDLKQKHL